MYMCIEYTHIMYLYADTGICAYAHVCTECALCGIPVFFVCLFVLGFF